MGVVVRVQPGALETAQEADRGKPSGWAVVVVDASGVFRPYAGVLNAVFCFSTKGAEPGYLVLCMAYMFSLDDKASAH